MPGRGAEGGTTADPGRGGHVAIYGKGRCGGRPWKGRAARSAIGGVSARPTIGGAGSPARLWRSECMADNGRGGGMWPAGEGWARRLGGQPGEGRTRHSAREEVSAATGGGAAQEGKGGGVAPAGKGGGVAGGADRANKLKTCELI
jgi:hypothetical protein